MVTGLLYPPQASMSGLLSAFFVHFFFVAKANFVLQLSTTMYHHRINRLKLVTRSALVGIIHTKTMESPSIAHDNGEATTLMSTDADSLDGIAEMVHETWAQVIEVSIGIRLLSLQVGWIWPLPLFLIYCLYLAPTICWILKFCSMFIYESICCKTFTASANGLECRNTESYRGDQLFHRRYESHQDDWITRQSYLSNTNPSEKGAAGGLKT